MARPKKNADEVVTDSTQTTTEASDAGTDPGTLPENAPEGDAQPPADGPPESQEEAKESGLTVRRQVTTEALNFSTLRMEPVVEVVEVEVAELPASVTLDAPHGFYEEDQTYRFWAADQVVTDSNEIALLIERGAVFKAE